MFDALQPFWFVTVPRSTDEVFEFRSSYVTDEAIFISSFKSGKFTQQIILYILQVSSGCITMNFIGLTALVTVTLIFRLEEGLGRLDIAPSQSENMSCMSVVSFALRAGQFLLSGRQELCHLSFLRTIAKTISRT